MGLLFLQGMAMNREQFIGTLLPAGGVYALFAKNKNEEFPKQKFYPTVDELLFAVDNEYEGYDLYFGLSTLKEAGNRTHVNVSETKSFFLDLDAKDFGSKKDALTALQAFCKSVKLPKPSLVDSGRGIHAYWLLDKAVDSKVWRKAAEKLKGLCAQHDFKADPAVTSDMSRVMRIPGTFNYKGDNPLPCKLISYNPDAPLISFEDFASKLGYAYVPEPELVVPMGFEGLADSLTDRLSGNTESSFKTIMQKTMKGKGCAQLRHAVVDSATLDEPTWRGALSIAVRCVDKDVALRKVSENHPDYSENRTRQKAEETKGPYTCDMFKGLNPTLCDGCPNQGKVKSPIVLGHQIIEATKVDENTYEEKTSIVKDGVVKKEVTARMPQPPKNYVYGKEGGVYFIDRDADGDPDYKVVSDHTLYAADRTYDDKEHGESLVMRVHLPHDGVRTFLLSLSTISSTDKLREELAKRGVMSLNQAELRKYIMSWVKHYQQEGAAKKPMRQYGWTSKEFKEFILGETVYTENGVELALPSEQTAPLNSYFDPAGSLTKWKNAMKLWEEPRYVQQQYAMGAGLGSILMQRDETNASILHLHSKESGVGKTAILRAIASVWGDPAGLLMNQKDSLATKMNRCEIYHNLPITFDEITNINAAEASDIIYNMTSGQQRNRMKSSANSERARGDTWALTAITTGNTSLIDRVCGINGKIDPQAEAQRVLELYVDRQFEGAGSKSVTDKFSRTINANYGHAGPIFVQWIINNQERTNKIIDTIREAVDKRAKLSSENRFWSAQVTYSISALYIAKLAGLLDYDHKLVLKWAVQKLLVENKENTVGMKSSAKGYVSDFLAENLGNVLLVKDDSDSKHNMADDTPLPPPEQRARIKLVGRYESTTGKLYLLISPFKEWCNTKQIPYRSIAKELREKHKADTNKPFRLGTGMNLPLHTDTEKVIAIDWGNLDDIKESESV